jgi:hypothetical protein
VVSVPFLVELIQWLIFHSSQINNSVFPGHFQIDISFEAGLILAVLLSIKTANNQFVCRWISA